jgi:hypothetical protein
MLQSPPQHSSSWAHASPFCVHHDDGPQIPPLQYCEQQSPLPEQVFPSVLHDVLSAAHMPPEHAPLQH